MELFKKEISEHARPSFTFDKLPPSTQKLITALEAENENNEIGGIIDLAYRQYWHDFDTEIEMPKVALARMLLQFKRGELAKRVADGEFDSGREEADAWFIANKDKIEGMVDSVGGSEKMSALMQEYFLLAGRINSDQLNRIFSRIVGHKTKKKGRRWG